MTRFYFQNEGGSEGGDEGGDEGGYEEGDEGGYEGGDEGGDEAGYEGGDEAGYEGGYEGGDTGIDSGNLESFGTFEWTGELGGNGPARVEDSGNAPINLDNSVAGIDSISDQSTLSNDPIEGGFEESSDFGIANGDPDNSIENTNSQERDSYRESTGSISWGSVVTVDPGEGSFTVPITLPEIAFIGPDLSLTFFTGDRIPSLSIGMGIGIPFTVGFKFGIRIGNDNGVYGGVNAFGFNQEALIDYRSFSQFLVHYSNAGGSLGPNSYSYK